MPSRNARRARQCALAIIIVGVVLAWLTGITIGIILIRNHPNNSTLTISAIVTEFCAGLFVIIGNIGRLRIESSAAYRSSRECDGRSSM